VEVSHVQLFFRDEPYNRARLSQLLEGLASENAKLKPRMPGELPRPVKSHADALKWLLENLAPPA
jgi:hypothetical protein